MIRLSVLRAALVGLPGLTGRLRSWAARVRSSDERTQGLAGGLVARRRLARPPRARPPRARRGTSERRAAERTAPALRRRLGATQVLPPTTGRPASPSSAYPQTEKPRRGSPPPPDFATSPQQPPWWRRRPLDEAGADRPAARARAARRRPAVLLQPDREGRRAEGLRRATRRGVRHELADRRVRQPRGPVRPGGQGPAPRQDRGPADRHDHPAAQAGERRPDAGQPAPRLLRADPGARPRQAQRGVRVRRRAAARADRRDGDRVCTSTTTPRSASAASSA